MNSFQDKIQADKVLKSIGPDAMKGALDMSEKFDEKLLDIGDLLFVLENGEDVCGSDIISEVNDLKQEVRFFHYTI